MKTLEIYKAQGSGNEFILLDIRHTSLSLSQRQHIAQSLCKREGLLSGADGVLFVAKSTNADAQMLIFNADGSEAKMCGNGLRIVGRWVAEKLGVEKVVVENVTNIAYELRLRSDFFESLKAIELSVQELSFDVATLPLVYAHKELLDAPLPILSNEYRFTALSLPNPHLIALTQKIDDESLEALGIKANQNKDLLPEGVNVSLVQKINEKEIFVRTYERGVGLTNSCGTAMFASVVSLTKNKLLQPEETITVRNKGGFTKVTLQKDFTGKMVGDVTYLYKGEVTFDTEACDTFSFHKTKDFDNETKAYEAFLESLASSTKQIQKN